MSRYPRGPVPRPVAREVNREAPERNCSGNLACFARNRPDRWVLHPRTQRGQQRQNPPAPPAVASGSAVLDAYGLIGIDGTHGFPKRTGHRKRVATRPQDHTQGIAQHERIRHVDRRRRRLMETDIGCVAHDTDFGSASRCGVSGFAPAARLLFVLLTRIVGTFGNNSTGEAIWQSWECLLT